MKALAAIPFFHGECVNLTISQQQLQLLRFLEDQLVGSYMVLPLPLRAD